MAVKDEDFDREKYWLLATVSRKVCISGRETMEYKLIWCSIPHGMIVFGGRTVEHRVYSGDAWPGASWSFAEFLETLNTREDLVRWQPSIVHFVWKDLHLEWFRPILGKLALGITVSYDEVNNLHMAANNGKPLRLYPFLAPVAARENWLMEMDYDY